jgi:hypothetical protein
MRLLQPANVATRPQSLLRERAGLIHISKSWESRSRPPVSGRYGTH